MDSRELIRKAEVAELLLLAARRLGESVEPERVYERFHELIGDVIQHDGLIVSSYDDRDDMIRCDYAWTDGTVLDAASLPPIKLNREGGGMQSRVIVTGEPVLFENVPERVTTVDGVYYNVDAEGRLEKIPDSGPAKTTSAMMVPVKDEGRVVGVVQVMTDRGVYSEDNLDRVEVAAQDAVARPVTLPVELGGRDLWLSFVAVRITDGVVYAFRDVTAETRLEEEKTDFVATISHELRTPMTAVYGAAQTLLRRQEISPEQRRQLIEMIATQAARLSQITEEILLTTRLDRDEITVHHEPVDVGAAVQSAVQAMRSHLPTDMEMQVEIAADVGRAAGDSDRIQQVLLNLIDNAAKHGRSPVRISAGTSNGLVTIAVSDSGPGIAPGERERIFEKFYRAGPQLTRLSGGTGLGLYISRELTRRVGGRLRVESEPGEGATFVVELSSHSSRP